jgi:mannosyltransferase
MVFAMDDVAVADATPPTPAESPAATTEPATPPPAATPGQRAATFARRVYWLWPALLTLGYGLWKIRVPSLWADELATWGAVRMGWHPLFQMLGHVDAVVAPYYTVMKVWTHVAGTSPVALRLPQVVAMTVAAGLLAVLVDRVGGRRAGILAGLAFAVVPATSRYAQEARPYAFAMMFAVLATLLLVRLMRNPGFGTAAVYALAIVGLGGSHLVGLLLLVAHAVVIRRRTLLPWAIATGCALLPLLPLVWLGHRESAQISWIQPATWESLLSTPDTVFMAGVVTGLLVVLGLLGVSRKPETVLLLSWALVPVLALYLISMVTPLYWPRYLLFTMPAWPALAALTLSRLSPVRSATVLVVLALLAHPAQYEMRKKDGHNHADSAAGGVINANYQPGDGIAFKNGEQPEPWEGRDIISRYVPAGRRPLDVFQVTPQRVNGRLEATECADLTACLDKADPPRLWVIRFASNGDPLHGIGPGKEDLLRSRYRLAKLYLVKGLTVALFVRD